MTKRPTPPTPITPSAIASTAHGTERNKALTRPSNTTTSGLHTLPRTRTRGTPRDELQPGDQIRALIFANEASRAQWIESELSRAPISITIQVARKVRTVVSALLRDPPPRPQVLIVDFDAVNAGELLELHEIRHDGWGGKLIGLGSIPPALCASLGVDVILEAPFVRDSLLDCVAGTRHSSVTVAIPLVPLRGEG